MDMPTSTCLSQTCFLGFGQALDDLPTVYPYEKTFLDQHNELDTARWGDHLQVRCHDGKNMGTTATLTTTTTIYYNYNNSNPAKTRTTRWIQPCGWWGYAAMQTMRKTTHTHTHNRLVWSTFIAFLSTRKVCLLCKLSVRPSTLIFRRNKFGKQKKQIDNNKNVNVNVNPVFPIGQPVSGTGKIVKLLPIYIGACRTPKTQAGLKAKSQHQLQRSPIKVKFSILIFIHSPRMRWHMGREHQWRY